MLISLSRIILNSSSYHLLLTFFFLYIIIKKITFILVKMWTLHLQQVNNTVTLLRFAMNNDTPTKTLTCIQWHRPMRRHGRYVMVRVPHMATLIAQHGRSMVKNMLVATMRATVLLSEPRHCADSVRRLCHTDTDRIPLLLFQIPGFWRATRKNRALVAENVKTDLFGTWYVSRFSTCLLLTFQ